jgi:hypothetical protein
MQPGGTGDPASVGPTGAPLISKAWALSALLFVSISAMARGGDDDRTLVWQSRNDTFRDLTKEFASLYANLIQLRSHGRVVAAATVEVPKGKTVTSVLRDRQLFDGVNLPRQLDVLVCQMNPGVCTVRPGQSGSVTADDAEAMWRIQAGAEIAVPEIRFTPIIVHRPYQKRPGDTLKSIVVDDRHGCESFDEECKQYIQNLNRRLPAPLDTAYGGQIIVPTKAYWAAIPLLDQSPEGGRPRDSQDLAELESSRDPLLVAPKLKRRVVPPATAKMHHGTAGQAAEGSRPLLLDLIRHPLAAAGEMDPGQAKVNVAVFDEWVDAGHCLLSKVTVLDPDGLGRAVVRVPPCGNRGDAWESADHGTHVTGLIAMRIDSAIGPGIAPYAAIKALSINPDSFVDPAYLVTQSGRLRELYKADPPDVVNMSFEYNLSTKDGQNDVFHAAMTEQVRNTLFVVSAGNDGAPLATKGECHVRPACYDDPNIVCVGALNLDRDSPALMSLPGKASNYGDRVHLAAPGEDIVSTISGDRVGVMSGTSQAAPQVAGAASLLYLYERRILPAQVKNRLIYTSDLFPALYDKVYGGRLNVRRLLAYKTATVDRKQGAQVDQLEGDIRYASGTYLTFVDFDTSAPLTLSLMQIRRMKYNADLGYYTLFYNDPDSRDTGPLSRSRAVLTNPAQPIHFRVPTGPGQPDRSVPMKAEDILDYVSPILL